MAANREASLPCPGAAVGESDCAHIRSWCGFRNRTLFELGLLWPHFMEFAGATIGSAFTLEGYAFFAEAIFLGLYLYGWERLSARAHWLTTIPIALSGLASGVLVVAVNAWMQYPTRVMESGVLRTDPWAPFASPAWLHMALHSALACYVATGFAAAGVYAVALLRGKRDAYHLSGLRIALLVGGVSAFAQPFSGDLARARWPSCSPQSSLQWKLCSSRRPALRS